MLKRSPITFMKALKNDTEIAGFKACHIRDGAAQVEFFAWLEAELKGGNDKLTEHGVALKQMEFRKKQQDYMGLSFETISSVGPNAAIIHYSPPESGGSVVRILTITISSVDS
jgi:Xaa-Pro aminopeptidase